ncbi:MAG: guanylate kinase [Thermodesulfobacteriota bacterium]
MSNKAERPEGIPFVVSGPSGAGKTTLYKMAVDFFDDLRHSISYTTRPPRQGETDGVEYHFIDDAAFDRMVEEGEFLEYACVHGRKYGTRGADLDALLDAGNDVLLEIDVQGAEKLRKAMDQGIYVFVIPPSIEACKTRLSSRGLDTPEEITKRLNIAIEEIKRAPFYDYIIVNDEVEPAIERLKSIITAEKARTVRMMPTVKDLFSIT